VTRRARLATVLALGATLVLAAACTSSASTSTSSGGETGQALSATVPPSSAPTGSSGSSSTERTTTTTGATGATGARPTACSLLPEAAVTAAFGEPVVAGDQSTDECWWSSANDLKTVNLIRRTDDIETWRSGYRNRAWTPNDLGDEGYTGVVLDSVVWRIGDVQYELNVSYSTTGDAGSAALALARQAEARL
jgi:hypothetical protein